MKEEEAHKLLDDTFSENFDILKLSNFLKEMFNTSELRTIDKTRFIDKNFEEYIKELHKIGEYKDRQGKRIELLTVRLAKDSTLERARTMQRNFVARWLKKNSSEPEGAIVAFYDDTKDWRFSFVKLGYKLVKNEKGNLGTRRELTPAKRYSYLVGKNEPNHTCKKQFEKFLLNDECNPTIEEIEGAFGVEKVTKEFFESYKELFLKLKDSLVTVVEQDANVRMEFEKIVGKEKEDMDGFCTEFSKKLLGQIVFLYFLQKKGWLGVQKEESGRFKPWGSGPKKFMRKLFEKEYGEYNNFFNDTLEPLFYNTLAIKRDEDFADKFNCKIPFLNGGLFEPLDNYKWIETNINLDNNIFKNIFDTFDEFNFTVKEDEPLEKEVAVDPEMLGKVFENLLEINDRKSKGAFYTPREIVHYMCQQSLINYLETNTKIKKEDIEKFIREGDLTLDQTMKAREHRKKYRTTYNIDSKYVIPKSIENDYEIVDDLLKEIKVVDPAVGSGAFLVGMMNEIVKARSILSICFKKERDTYELKRACVENSLYGVDIMPSAVSICQLRFWLSLIVDETDRSKIKPLPNLDNKIMCGNSLVEEFEGVKLFDERLLGEYAAGNESKINQLKGEIKKLNIEKGEIIKAEKKGDIKQLKKEIKELEKKKTNLEKQSTSSGSDSTLSEIGGDLIRASKKKFDEMQELHDSIFNESDREQEKRTESEE